MPDTQTSDSPQPDIIAQLREAALSHVPFDGWSAETFAAAVRDTGIDPDLARAICPRGAVDLAVSAHHAGDAALAARAEEIDISALRYSEKVAELIWQRIQLAGDAEVVRRATTLFALPQHAAEGAGLIWGTADTIWRVLGDASNDVNWYTKRMTLSAVYGSCVLFWLGDTSEGHADTRAFIDRRIADVMRFEKVKADLRGNPLLKPFLALPERVLGQVRAPAHRRAPGRVG
ncbi:COQ9 family protein [Arenibacterium halophilum]|uniref:COQ9 family protein n=1 Tax=Arenibacterium halophilum TaxID=2583821 RepID=A0ABY2X902_9RHOB|nr:COQ9 family protein [Arenibacterium halophilum]TMV11773.1 COQ9 family protein [Arenibacterium halophilum]